MFGRRRDHSFDEVEALTSRIFAEKQLAVALLAMTLVAHLAVAQFLLLRLDQVQAGATGTPDPAERVDVDCAGGALVGRDGVPMDTSGLAGRTVVVHLDAATNACLQALAPVDLGGLVVGVPAGVSR